MPVSIRQQIVSQLDALFKTILTTTYLTRVSAFAVPLANMKISAVNGTAFLDCGALGASLLTHLGERVTVTDSAGKTIVGFIKAAGTGETLGDEKVGSGDCENSALGLFDTFDGVSNNGFHAIRSTAGSKYCGTADQIPLVAGQFILRSATLVRPSGADTRWSLRSAIAQSLWGAAQSNMAVGANSVYETVVTGVNGNGVVSFTAADNQEITVSGISVKQVLTPAATGVTITSASGGSTFNWASKDAAFNYADASGYTVTIAAPYDSSIGTNVFWWRDTDNNPLTEAELPAMNCRDTADTVVRAIGQHEHTLTIEAVASLRSSDSGDSAREAAADIVRALGTNVSPNTCLGGYAEDIGPIASEVIEVVHEGIKGFGVALRFEVTYVTAPFDPYTQV